MSTLSTAHTLVPNASIPLGYFDEDNIRFVQQKATETLKREYTQNILFDRGSVIRMMERALLDRVETVPKMNQRAVMYLTNDFRIHELTASKHMKWEAGARFSQLMYDPLTNMARFDPQNIKLANHLGKLKVGGTTRFYFT